jgi:hypothetical protein
MARALLATAAALVAAADASNSARTAAAAPYAPWAHTHWVWLSLDPTPSFPAALTALVEGYVSRNISVGAVDIDSGWATGYNSFVPITSAFPDWHGFIGGLKSSFNVRVILWMTSMIDHDSPNFGEALSNSYFVLDGFNRPAVNLSWWHGVGGLLDYSNPAARAWWEALIVNSTLGGAASGGAGAGPVRRTAAVAAVAVAAVAAVAAHAASGHGRLRCRLRQKHFGLRRDDRRRRLTQRRRARVRARQSGVGFAELEGAPWRRRWRRRRARARRRCGHARGAAGAHA